MTEAEHKYLETYDITKYDRPSVAVDVVAFTVLTEEETNNKRDAKPKLAVLLVKRGEHPYKDCWALPGGFVRSNETLEQCAIREITEETSITPTAIMPIGTFSDPKRDPRGRIISNAYVSVISGEKIDAIGGDDAVDAAWFDCTFQFCDAGLYMKLVHDKTEIYAELSEKGVKFGVSEFTIKKNMGLAFDHALILARAISCLRNTADDFDILFDFLPEKFTLAQMQSTQEAILNVKLLTANFRRKAALYIEETDEYTSGVGHRPAQLFRKKTQ